jgi:pilus assembly protein Flp/PilA
MSFVASPCEEDEMKSLLSTFLVDNSGATAIEYGLIAGLISVVIIGAVARVGTRMSTKFNTIAGALT